MEAAQRDDTLRTLDLEVRLDDGLVLAAGRVLALSHYELRLLAVLIGRESRIVSREDLYRLAWGSQMRPGDRSVDVYVHRLRTKLEAAAPHRAFIHTHFGFGYRFAPQPTEINS